VIIFIWYLAVYIIAGQASYYKCYRIIENQPGYMREIKWQKYGLTIGLVHHID